MYTYHTQYTKGNICNAINALSHHYAQILHMDSFNMHVTIFLNHIISTIILNSKTMHA